MIILGTNSIKDTGFNVANSCRFNDGDSACMHKTPSSSGNRRTFTFSTWVKKTNDLTSNVYNDLYSAYDDANNISRILFWDSNALTLSNKVSGSFPTFIRTNRLFKDPTAWYHLVIAVDTTDGTEANRVKIYVNGIQETSLESSNYPSQNEDFFFNHTNEHNVGQQGDDDSALYFDGYLAETVMIDGLQLAPTSFGEFDEDTPKTWKPIDVSGLTFGTNGFYLDYEDSSNLGNDKSGGTDFTEVNLAATDQTTDTCTLNGCTLNPLDVNPASAGDTFSEGNLKLATNSNSNAAGSRSTFAFTKGKWYVESKYTSSTAWNGVMATDTTITGGMTTGTITWYQGRTLYVDGSNTATWGSAVSAGDIVGIALDMDNSRVTISQGGQWWGGSSFNQSQPHTFQNLTSGYDTWSFLCRSGSATSTSEWNFGSPPFAISSSNSDANGYGNMEYTVPTGYYIPNSANLAEYG